MDEEIRLYMILELEKVRQYHIDNIWIRPFGKLVFEVFVIRNQNVYIFFLKKRSVFEKWICTVENGIFKDKNGWLDFSYDEVLDMIKKIDQLDLKGISKYCKKYKDVNIFDKMKMFQLDFDTLNCNLFELEEKYRQSSAHLLENICNMIDNEDTNENIEKVI
jgi:hypothetical protein